MQGGTVETGDRRRHSARSHRRLELHGALPRPRRDAPARSTSDQLAEERGEFAPADQTQTPTRERSPRPRAAAHARARRRGPRDRAAPRRGPRGSTPALAGARESQASLPRSGQPHLRSPTPATASRPARSCASWASASSSCRRRLGRCRRGSCSASRTSTRARSRWPAGASRTHGGSRSYPSPAGDSDARRTPCRRAHPPDERSAGRRARLGNVLERRA